MRNDDMWNTFHDGLIVSASGSVPGDLELGVEQYELRKEFDEPGEIFIVKLLGCESLSFERMNYTVATGKSNVILLGGLRILSATQDQNCVTLLTEPGIFKAIYRSGSIALESGRSITLEELDAAAQRSYDNWKEHE